MTDYRRDAEDFYRQLEDLGQERDKAAAERELSRLLKARGGKGDVREIRKILERLARDFGYDDAGTERFVSGCMRDLLERSRE